MPVSLTNGVMAQLRLREVNRKEVKPKDTLSYTAYKYDAKAVDILADRLAEKLFDNILKGKYKQEIQDMAEKICSFAEEEKQHGR